MFTESVRNDCSFPACCGGLAKYQTCLIFHRPSLTLYPDLSSSHLVKIEVPTDRHTGDTAADIQAQKQQREKEGKGGSHEGGNYTLNRGGSGQKAFKN